MAMGRTLYQDPDPAEMAGLVDALVHGAMILTIDFGTTVTKVGLWGDDGLVALARSELTTTHPQVGWAEQDPLRWWTTAGHRLRRGPGAGARGLRRGRRRRLLGRPADLRPGDLAGRPDRQGHPVVRPPRRRPRRAVLAERMGGDDINRARTGIPLDAGAVAAKLAWLAEHEPERLRGGRRHPLAARLRRLPHDGPGRDRRHVRLAERALRLRRQRRARAGRSGAGQAAERRAVRHGGGPAEVGAGRRARAAAGHPGRHRRRRPPVRGPGFGRVRGPPHGELGHHGQRLGAGARAPGALAGRRRGHAGGRRGLAARGRACPPPGRSWPGWAACSTAPPTSWRRWPARARPAPAAWSPCRGSTAPGRPWWRDDARAGFMGLGAAHGAADLARAVIESVAWDVLRCHGGGDGRAAWAARARRGCDARRRRHRDCPCGSRS